MHLDGLEPGVRACAYIDQHLFSLPTTFPKFLFYLQLHVV